MSRSIYFDRQGKPMTQDAWSKAFSDRKYQVVEQTQVGHLLVSTVWLGIDHSFKSGPPIIFETLVLDGLNEIEGTRYSTEAQALRGHKKFVRNTLNRRFTLDQLAKVAPEKGTNASARRRKRER